MTPAITRTAASGDLRSSGSLGNCALDACKSTGMTDRLRVQPPNERRSARGIERRRDMLLRRGAVPGAPSIAARGPPFFEVWDEILPAVCDICQGPAPAPRGTARRSERPVTGDGSRSLGGPADDRVPALLHAGVEGLAVGTGHCGIGEDSGGACPLATLGEVTVELGGGDPGLVVGPLLGGAAP